MAHTPAVVSIRSLRRWLAHPAVLLIAALLCVLMTSACSDDTGNETINPTTNSGDAGNNATDAADAGPDAADVDAGPDAASPCADVTCEEADEVCVDGECVPSGCTSDEDLGVVASDDTPISVTISAEEGQEDYPQASCSSADAPSSVIKFTADEPARVNFEVSSDEVVDWVVELRKDTCSPSEENRIFCTDNERDQFFVEEGVTYYLIVQPIRGQQRAPVTVDMTWTPLECSPPGKRRCKENTDNVEGCFATGWQELRCATTCSDDLCHGDVCANAITVEQSGLYEGDNEAYDSSFDFADRADCSATGEAGLSTPGPEVIFALPDLTTGQIVTVDTSEEQADTNDNAIFILDDCSQQAACLEAVDLGEKLTYEVPEDGTYYLVVDKTSWRGVTFSYHIDID